METVHAVRRHAIVNFSSSAFVGAQKGRYLDLWGILGQPWTNQYLAAAWAVNTIPGPEHGVLDPNFTISEEQIDEIFPILVDMKWFTGMQLRPGIYDHLLMTGAKFQAMIDRAVTMLDRLGRDKGTRKEVAFRHIYGLFGQRPREDKVDGTVEHIWSLLSDNVKRHPWVVSQWALRNETHTYALWEGPFATEFELGILSIIVAADGNVQIDDSVPCNDTVALPDVPLRTVESCTVTLADGTQIIAINAPAVERDYGPPRPTSTSTTSHLVEHYGVQDGETIVVITVRVHGPRIVGDIEREIHSQYPGIEVRGFSNGVMGDPKEFFNHALAETVNQQVKCVEEQLNAMRPAGAPALNVKQVRQYLNRIHQNPTTETVAAILMEVTLGLVRASTVAG